jgi:Transposase DDE domain
MINAIETKPKPKSRARARREEAGVAPQNVFALVERIFQDDLHAKTVLSLSTGVVGVLHAALLGIHAIGRGLAAAKGLNSKHATKQIDRLLSNGKVHIWRLFPSWIHFVVGPRTDLLVALDWTEFDADDQATICAYLITRHGRATPLVWHTVYKSTLEGQRNRYEDEVLQTLRAALPDEVRVTVLADRGFGDQKRYKFLTSLGFHYVIRFRQDILVTDEFGNKKPAVDWLHKSGRAQLLKKMAVTGDFYIVPGVVVVHDKRMADPWCLATSRDDLGAADLVKLYGRRFTIEETFRDTKDIHFGMGLKATHIGDSSRRDRLLLLGAVAHALLTLLGAAGERAGLDRLLKTNTSKKRQLSLYRQGCFWYDALPNMPDERLVPLLRAYDEILGEQPFFREIFGII